MLALTLPQDTAFYQIRVDLEGTDYLLDFQWCARAGLAGQWLLSVSDAEGVRLLSGVSVVCNRMLLVRYKSIPGIPAGDFMALDATREISTPNYTQLGQEVTFMYLTAAEVA